MAVYALQTDREYGVEFLHEFDNVAEYREAERKLGTGTMIHRVYRDEAKQWVKRDLPHSTRFWVDGGTVRG